MKSKKEVMFECLKCSMSRGAPLLLFLSLFLSNAFSFPLDVPDPRVERSSLLYAGKCSSMVAEVAGHKDFFIISRNEIKKLGLSFLNGGEDNVCTVRSGSRVKRIALSANQRRVVLLETGKTFSNVNYFYELSVKAEKKLHIKFIPDRFAFAFVCLRSGEYKRAREIFEELLRKNPELIEARLFLGVAYERDGFRERAVGVFREAVDTCPSLNAYRSSKIQELTGMGVDEIESLRRLRFIPWDLHILRGVYVKGGALFRAKSDEPGELLYGPYIRLPEGAYTVEYTLSSPGPATEATEAEVVRIDVVDHPKKIAERYIRGDELAAAPKKFYLSFFNEDPWAKLEFRVAPTGAADILAGDVNVFCDTRQSLRKNNLIITESMKKLGIYNKSLTASQ